MIKISASIVVYNENKETLTKAINSFNSINLEKELIIVDNSPVSNLKKFIEEFDNTKYIFNNKNIGFGAGHNLAFKNLQKKSDIHMIINPDVYFNGNDIKNMTIWMQKDKNISLCVPQVLNANRSVQNIVRNIPTISGLLKRKLHLGSGELDIKNNTIANIPFAHGCFLIFKTTIFTKLNGFDERFFMYMEDVDICMRAKQFGKTVINSNFNIYHEYRKGSSKNIKLLIWHLTSAIKFFWIHK
ncbi:Glycosyl transferase, group 2 family protein [hydrothermal vent metagenome]|uniref:Glycosyl transferase, group 2 family protein n=1 Tax=hydrothermal vent metagenome TaxID=652676 RepID=A0A3B1E5J0_9ZZZZ